MSLLFALVACVLVSPSQHQARKRQWVAVSAGVQNTCAINLDGEIMCWGAGDRDDPFSLLNPPQAGPYTQVAVGLDHACALDSDGSPVCWGSTGDGKTSYYGDANGFEQIVVSDSFSCARSVSQVVCWGDGADTKVPDDYVFTHLAAGDDSVCGLTDLGAIQCWGRLTLPEWQSLRYQRLEAYGAVFCAQDDEDLLLCPSTDPSIPDLNPPDELPSYDAYSVGGFGLCGIDRGDVVCSGELFDAQPRMHTVLQIDAGGGHACAITEKNDLACWGDDSFGQLPL